MTETQNKKDENEKYLATMAAGSVSGFFFLFEIQNVVKKIKKTALEVLFF